MGGGGNDAVKSTNTYEIQILSAGYQKPAKTGKKIVRSWIQLQFFFIFLSAWQVRYATPLALMVKNKLDSVHENCSSFSNVVEMFRTRFYTIILASDLFYIITIHCCADYLSLWNELKYFKLFLSVLNIFSVLCCWPKVMKKQMYVIHVYSLLKKCIGNFGGIGCMYIVYCISSYQNIYFRNSFY
jgi:hypothetical protein